MIFLIIDCLRADHVGFYGYKKAKTPNIDNLAKKSIVFEQAITQAPWTLPSHASMFTSKYLSTHKVDSVDRKLGDWELTLAEILKIYGYDTAAFVSGNLLDKQYNLDQGFNLYFQMPSEENEKNSPELLKYAQEWIKTRRKSKFFLFIHNNDTHAPLHFPNPFENMHDPDYKGIVDNLFLNHWLVFDPFCCYPKIGLSIKKKYTLLDYDPAQLIITYRDFEHIIAHYDGGITFVDKFVGDLMEFLKNCNLMKRTIIIVTADHGEGLLSHKNTKKISAGEKSDKNLNYFWHEGVFYDEVLHVPLIIYHPDNKKNLKIKTQVELIDILPTLLAFLNIPEKIDAQGSSLLPLIEGGDTTGFKKYAFSEDGKFFSIRTEKWKMINFESYNELYNLETDPFELKDLSAEFPLKIQEFSERIQQFKSNCRINEK